MTKKILKISAFVLIILVLALLGYYFILSTNDNVAGGKKPFFGNLFPFGNNVNTNELPFTSTTTEVVQPTEPGTFEQKIRLISDEPVAGSTFTNSVKGDVVRYIEKATGHIFDVPTFENTNSRVSNTTIPQIYKAMFAEDGSSFIAQYTKDGDTIETFYGKLIGTSTEKIISGNILAQSVVSFAVSPDQKSIFTLENSRNGSEGYISSPNGTSKKLIWTSPLKEFIPYFISTTHVGLQSKPHSSALGVLFDINISNAVKSVIISNQANLSTLPYTKKPYVLYSNNIGLYTVDTKTNFPIEISPKTFPEKCVWANTKTFIYCAVPKTALTENSLYDWYQGKVSYSDDIWEYDVVGNTARQVYNLEEIAGRAIDVFTISINQADSLLLIQSKIDDSLWTVKLN